MTFVLVTIQIYGMTWTIMLRANYKDENYPLISFCGCFI